MKIKISYLGFIIVGLVAVLVWAGCSYGQYGAVSSVTRRNYQVLLGSSVSSPATLTNGYTGASSTPVTVSGLPNYVLSVAYTPKSYGSYVYLLVERATNSSCTTYYPFTNLSPSTDRTTVYNTGASSTDGIPFMLGASGTYASGTTQYASFDFTGVANCLRVSAKEHTTSTAGTIYSDVLITSY